jgi:hypothetical protein
VDRDVTHAQHGAATTNDVIPHRHIVEGASGQRLQDGDLQPCGLGVEVECRPQAVGPRRDRSTMSGAATGSSIGIPLMRTSPKLASAEWPDLTMNCF